MAIIYLGTNTINGKQYIGSTRYTLEQRLYNKPYGHIYLAFNEKLKGGMSIMELHKAIRAFGENVFKWEILEEQANKTFESNEMMYNWLDEREKFYIEKYDTINTGYNETTGGRKNYYRSESNRRKISETTKEAMSKLNTKELCNPHRYMTEEQKRAYIERCNASKRGKLAHNKGKRLMNNKINYKYVDKIEVDKYLAEGWVLGFMRRRKGAK